MIPLRSLAKALPRATQRLVEVGKQQVVVKNKAPVREKKEHGACVLSTRKCSGRSAEFFLIHADAAADVRRRYFNQRMKNTV